jgi:3-hydroxyacyl-[acyl-carrier-protein] dehydratase
MRFCHLDQILELEAGLRIVAVKRLSGTEDYLRDHFPRFAVMPGVLMLEALFQASALLVRATDNYQHGLVLLRSAKNVKFADFVQPGQQLDILAEVSKVDGNHYTLKASGHKEGRLAVSGRLVVECTAGNERLVDRYASQYMRQLTNRLRNPAMD